MKKSGKGIIFGAVVLTFAGLLAKIVGAFYKIPLTNILGSAGIGIYYLIFPIFSILLVLSSSGVSIALIKCISSIKDRRSSRAENMYFMASLVLSAIMSIFFAVIMICFCKEISAMQGNANGYLGYVFIAPALVIASIIAVVRAYFQGIENMIPTSISMIIEQVTKTICGLILAKLMYGFGVEYAVLGAVLGVSVSEFVALIIMIINYATYQNKLAKYRKITMHEKRNVFSNVENANSKEKYRVIKMHNLNFGEAMLEIVRATIPNTLSQMILPLCSAIDAYLVINLLTQGGISTMTATTLYGLYYGIVTTIIGLALIVINGLSTAIMPNISRMISMKDADAEGRCAFYIKLIWCVALLMVLIFVLFGRQIIILLYGGAMNNNVIDEVGIAGGLLLVSSVLIMYYALLSAFVTILQSIGKYYTPACVMCIMILIRIAIMVPLCQNSAINVLGGLIAQVVFLSMSACVCAYFVKKYVNIEFSKYRMMVVPIFSLAISGCVGILCKSIFSNINVIIVMSFVSIIVVALYCLLLIKLKCFNPKEYGYMGLKKLRFGK